MPYIDPMLIERAADYLESPSRAFGTDALILAQYMRLLLKRAEQNPPVPIDSEMPCRGGPAPSDWKGPKQAYAESFRALWDYASAQPAGNDFCNQTRDAAEIAFNVYAGAGPRNPITECVAAVILRRILKLETDFPLPHPAVPEL